MGRQVTTITQCKVCTSKMRAKIEELYIENLVPEKIVQYLKSLSSPVEKAIVEEENISMSSMYRHFKKHFDINDGAKVAVAETRTRIDESRNLFQQGVQIAVDKINTLNHLIDVQLIKIEQLEKHSDMRSKDAHALTISYMNNARLMIETLSKLTGDLRQEGTVDINFFNGEIQVFADIVLETVRQIDEQLGLDGVLESSFMVEFQRQFTNYNNRLERISNGELSVEHARREQNTNKFNQS